MTTGKRNAPAVANGNRGVSTENDDHPSSGDVETSLRDAYVARLLELATAAAELVDDIEGQQRREAAEFAEGYRLGFEAGREVGYGQAEHDMSRAWSKLADKVRLMASVPTFAELQRRRQGKREAA